MVQEYIQNAKEYINKYATKIKDYAGTKDQAKKKKVRQKKKEPTKSEVIKEKLASKAGPALFLLLLVGVFGGAAIGHLKCERGFRNAYSFSKIRIYEVLV